VETGNPSACAVGTVNCGIVIALYVSEIKSGCNQNANKIPSSKLEPIIYVTYTPHTCHSIYNCSIHVVHYILFL
jgi:hypothetical protein